MFISCIKEEQSLVFSAKSDFLTPLHVAVEFGRELFVKELIE